MGRRLLPGVALAAVSCALGFVSAAAETDWGNVPTKPIPAASRKALRKALTTAMDSIPAPQAPYVLRPEESTIEVDAKVPWDEKANVWREPVRATAERYYEVPEEAAGISETEREILGPIEIRLEFNGQTKVGGLESEGGEPTLFSVSGAVAIEISTVAPGETEGRVAAMTPQQSDYRLTSLTVMIGDQLLEASARNLVHKEPGPWAWDGVHKLFKDPSEIRRIFIRIHGPKKPVEDLARRIPAAALRRLLRG